MISPYFGQLPDNWEYGPLSEIADINPKFAKNDIDDELEVSFVPMPAVEAESGAIDVTTTKLFKEVKKGYTGFLEKDVLFAKITPCMENGKMAVVPALKNNVGFGSTEFHVIRALDKISPQYIYYFVSSKLFRIDAEHNMTGAVGQRRVPTNYLSACKIPLPPLNEQRQIVAKIEELFSELDKGIESLKTARSQLKIYRQAVLKHAFEGKLTAQWREEHKDQLESPEQLLARIQQEREARYQQQLTDWRAALKTWEQNGKAGKKPGKPKDVAKVQKLISSEIKLSPIPKGWLYVYAENISDFITKGTTPQKDDLYEIKGDVPFIKVYNLTHRGILDFSVNPTFISHETHNEFLTRSKVKPGDILMNIVGPPLGKISLVPDTFPEWNINQAIVRYRTFNCLSGKYLAYYLLSQGTIDRMSSKSKATAGQFNLTLEICRDLEIPVCSPAEQALIIEEIESRLSICDSFEVTISGDLIRAETLRQSILKKAFSGQLVPQDPNDEPAAVLLDRIRAAKAAQPKPSKKP